MDLEVKKWKQIEMRAYYVCQTSLLLANLSQHTPIQTLKNKLTIFTVTSSKKSLNLQGKLDNH